MRLIFALTLGIALCAALPATSDAAATPSLASAIKTIVDAYSGNFASLRGPSHLKLQSYSEYLGNVVPAGYKSCNVTQNTAGSKTLYGYRCSLATGGGRNNYNQKAAAAMPALYTKTVAAIKQLKPSASAKSYTAVDSVGQGAAKETVIRIPGGPMVTVFTRDVKDISGVMLLSEVKVDVETPRFPSMQGWHPSS